ncbi:methionyl-tRNA formyltransferase [uncultured Castellaniella sp.]|uniref:methionyl-tRNA formyltransferase n=1 Tax=uncultured Castellaniella sp. TaxID=647907 RepID=UPI00260EF5D4|nr:methionyl-tRNA formyltransferase [uncultured Castellaniella sp.]
MRVVFAGTPEFARQALAAILQAGHQVAGVLTQPDRPSGRGMKLQPGPVKQAALDAGVAVQQPRSLRLDGKFADEARSAQAALQAWAPDVMVVAAYGLILPQWVLDLPRHGCLNIHVSLLPRWRGAAPIQRAIEAGDAASGITIMQMDAGLDTGAMLLQVERPIGPDDTGASLHDALAQDGAGAIVRVLGELDAGRAPAPVPQPLDGITYADKLQKSESVLDFSLPAAVLARRIRAFDPFPGTTMVLPGIDQPVKVWAAHALPPDRRPGGEAPGAVVRTGREGIDVATADGLLRITVLQKPGSRRQPADVFLQSYRAP